jgi:YfiH family protein
VVQLYPFTCSFRGALPYASFPFMMDGRPAGGAGCVISSRMAGNMVYSEGVNGPARERFFRSLGLEPERVYACTQIHSRRVLEVDRGTPNRGPEADGMISRDPGVILSVSVADCMPVYLYDTRSGGFGLVHSGWRGTGIVLTALELMAGRWGARPREVAAVLGPAIRGCCYRVDEERARSFEAEFGGRGGAYPLGELIHRVREFPAGASSGSGAEGEAWYIDLPAANARLLVNAGVRNIAVCEDCTFTGSNFGSFRREGPDYTRMAALTGHLQGPAATPAKEIYKE